jgi:hypothetical protein
MTARNSGNRKTAAHGGHAQRQHSTSEQATVEQRGGRQNIMVEHYGVP